MNTRCAATREPSASERTFRTTHWGVVAAAAQQGTAQYAAALERLCRTYWYPLYAYVRRRGHSPEDAEDLTQEFFARLLTKEYISRAQPHKGKFRSFLLAGIKNLLADEHDKACRLKRGGGMKRVPLYGRDAEERYGREAADLSSPELLFERRWAAAILENAMERLRQEYSAAGKANVYTELIEFRRDSSGQRRYSEVARRLGASESAVKSAVHRFRERHQQLVREEIAHTVENPAEVDEEIRYLLRIVAG